MHKAWIKVKHCKYESLSGRGRAPGFWRTILSVHWYSGKDFVPKTCPYILVLTYNLG